jgi:hypothetical protein
MAHVAFLGTGLLGSGVVEAMLRRGESPTASCTAGRRIGEHEFVFADEGQNREQSVFVQDTIRAGRLTLSAGLRFDRYDFVVRDQAFGPRLGIAWAAAPDVVLRASDDSRTSCWPAHRRSTA